MLELLRKSWWTLSLRGLFIVFFGVSAIMDAQKQTSFSQGVYNAYGIFFKLGLMFMATGGLLLATGLVFRKKLSNWFVLVITAIPDLVLAIYIFANGQKATIYYTKIMGIWIVLLGLVFLVVAFRVKFARVLLFILAFICTAFGLIVIFNPEFSVFSVNGTIAYFTVLLGLAVITLGISARKVGLKKTPPANGVVQGDDKKIGQ